MDSNTQRKYNSKYDHSRPSIPFNICHTLLRLNTEIIGTSAWGNGNSGWYTFDCFAVDNLIYKINKKH